MMAERGIALAHTTILCWVQQYVPNFEKRNEAVRLPVGESWRVEETLPQGAWPMGGGSPTGKETRRSGNLGGGAGRMKSAKPLARQKHTPIEICTQSPRGSPREA
jgi:hypothetical protein